MAYLEESLELTLRQLIPVIQHRIMNESTYFGVKTLKSPTDFWVYQEIIYETRPDVIIEIGNYCGGSTLALAHLCDCLGHGRVIGVDLSHANVPETVRSHARITLIEGDAGISFDRVARLIEPEDKVLIIEDSSHTYENTLQALNTYSPLVKPGGYFIVEDGICHHGLDGGPFPGPFEAVETFVSQRANFVVDRSREAFLLTWNPKGYLRRLA
jgi:cephalosporin hydroxylase